MYRFFPLVSVVLSTGIAIGMPDHVVVDRLEKAKFPKGGVERASRIVEGDGGYLDLARSRDGRRLWVRRSWDDGSTDVTEFRLKEAGSPTAVLQFVDGIVDPKTDAVAELPDPHPFRYGGEQWFVQYFEAWVIDVVKQVAVRPATQQTYPLVAASRTSKSSASRVQWMVFVKKCPEAAGGCVYFGNPAEVCGRYFDNTTLETGQALWIAPRKRCRGHW